MKNLLLSGIMLICSMVLWNCSDNKENGQDDDGGNSVATRLQLSATELVFEADGGEKVIDIECDGGWVIEPTSEWCSLSAVSGNTNQVITVKVGEYEETDDRNVVFIVKAGVRKVVLTVIQKHKDALILDKDKFEVPNGGGNVAIRAKSSMECTLFIPVEFQGWISKAPDSRAMVDKTFNLTIAESKDYNERVGYVEISGSGLKDTVYIYQAHAGQLILVEDTYLLNADAQNITVELKTNVDYDFIIPESVTDWVSKVESRASRTDKLNLTIKENAGTEWREAALVIKDKNNELTDTLYIKQAPEGVVFLSQNRYEVKSEGATIDIELLSGVEKFETAILDGADQWLKIVQNRKFRSLTKHKLQLEVSPNMLEVREGRIAFSDGESGDTLTIVQVGHTYTLSFVESDIEVSSKGMTIETILKSDVDYQLSIVAPAGTWITQVSSGSTMASGMKEERLKFEIKPNDTPDTRTGEIIVKDNNSELADTLRVIQRGLTDESVYKGNLTFVEETDLEKFFDGGYTVVNGNLTISGNTLTTLATLRNQLREITGNLIIDCPLLKNFKGLEALTTISGDFEIRNGSFTSFAGLEKLTTLDGSLRVNAIAASDNQNVLTNLSSFEGLSGLKKIGMDLEVSAKNTIRTASNNALTALASFKGLDNLTKIGGKFKMNGSVTTQGIPSASSFAKFVSFAGLEKLETIEGNFEINAFANVAYDTRLFPLLTSFEGLNALKRLGGEFKITVSVTTAGEYLQPWGMAKLASLKGLENLETIGGDFIITGFAANIGGTSGGGKSDGKDDKPEKPGNYYTPKVLTDLTTLNGLRSLKTVSGQNFKISGCPSLNNFSTLQNVLSNYTGTFTVVDCLYNPTKEQILNGE